MNLLPLTLSSPHFSLSAEEGEGKGEKFQDKLNFMPEPIFYGNQAGGINTEAE